MQSELQAFVAAVSDPSSGIGGSVTVRNEPSKVACFSMFCIESNGLRAERAGAKITIAMKGLR